MKSIWKVVVVVAVVALGSFALGYVLPDFNIIYLATPVVENGQTPLQVFQPIALAVLAIITLIFTFWRTRVADRQSQIALAQIELNQAQFDKTNNNQSREDYQKAVEMVTQADGNQLHAIGGMQRLRTHATIEPEALYEEVELILTSYINFTSEQRYPEQLIFLEELRNTTFSHKDTVWKTLPPNIYNDTAYALDILSELRPFKPVDSNKPTCLNNSVFRQIAVAGDNLSDVSFGGIFEKCTFKKTDLRNTEWFATAMKDCVFIDCDLSAAHMEIRSFGNCKIVNCRVNNATLVLQGEWTLENNPHSPDQPPNGLLWGHLYQADIDEELRKLDEEINERTDVGMSEQDVDIYAIMRSGLINAVPKFVID